MMKPLKEYFTYSRIERQGLVVLIVLCILFYTLPFLNFWGKRKTTDTDFTSYQADIQAFTAALENTSESKVPSLFFFDPNTIGLDSLQLLGLSTQLAQRVINYREKVGAFKKAADFRKIYGLSATQFAQLEPYVKIAKTDWSVAETKVPPPNDPSSPKQVLRLFSFDPNTVRKEELQQLGFSEKTITILLKYRNKGGRFRKAEDLRKIYGLSEAHFEKVLPYIQIENLITASEEPEKPSEDAPPKQELIQIDINSADVATWQQLKGIGPAYSKRIVKFREGLGGFVSIAQIAETYGLPDSTFQQIKPHLVILTPATYLNINQVTEEELAAHLYLSRKLARLIINYRDQHGPFQKPEDLARIKVLPSEVLNKLSPYLKF